LKNFLEYTVIQLMDQWLIK